MVAQHNDGRKAAVMPRIARLYVAALGIQA
jgi:hypothetical protein